MTIGHLIECVVNRTACNVGYEIDSSACENHDVEKYFEHLEKKGINRYSNEIMYNARTGQQMNTEIFIGPTYYYRLKHMVNDKINYRDRSGPIENITDFNMDYYNLISETLNNGLMGTEESLFSALIELLGIGNLIFLISSISSAETYALFVQKFSDYLKINIVDAMTNQNIQ